MQTYLDTLKGKLLALFLYIDIYFQNSINNNVSINYLENNYDINYSYSTICRPDRYVSMCVHCVCPRVCLACALCVSLCEPCVSCVSQCVSLRVSLCVCLACVLGGWLE